MMDNITDTSVRLDDLLVVFLSKGHDSDHADPVVEESSFFSLIEPVENWGLLRLILSTI